MYLSVCLVETEDMLVFRGIYSCTRLLENIRFEEHYLVLDQQGKSAQVMCAMGDDS